MWIARNSNGYLVLFERKPHRTTAKCYNSDGTEDCINYWEGEIVYDNGKGYEDESLFLYLCKDFEYLKWEDEPVEVGLIPLMRTTCPYCKTEFTFTEHDIVDASIPEEENFWMYVPCPECGAKCGY